MDNTKNYYNTNAKLFFDGTVNACMSDLYKEFEIHLNKGDKLLDLGCGSGRDSSYFLKKGFEVVSVDYSKELCKLANEHFNINVICMDMKKINYDQEFNGVWASASLLHVKRSEILDVMNKIYNSLIWDGVLYLGFKYGNKEEIRNERFFNSYDESSFIETISCTKFKIEKLWQTKDVRPGRDDEKWLNIILKKN